MALARPEAIAGMDLPDRTLRPLPGSRTRIDGRMRV
jgi:hypothetical protein